MSRNLDDLTGDSRDEILTFYGSFCCSECDVDVDEGTYNKTKGVLTLVCIKNHKSEIKEFWVDV